MNQEQLIQYCKDQLQRHELSKVGVGAVLPPLNQENYTWEELKIASLYAEFSTATTIYRDILKELEKL